MKDFDKEFPKTLNSYQSDAHQFAIYPAEYALIYCSMKLAGEAGEVAEKVAKEIRDTDWRPGQPLPREKAEELIKELGDVLWYVAELSLQLGFSLGAVAHTNLSKLNDRKERGVLKGSGDER